MENNSGDTMMKFPSFMVCSLISVCASSCIVPYPHRTHLRKSFSGVAVDSRTQLPIKDAEITVDYGSEKVSTKSGRRGEFKTNGKYIQHWALMLAPIQMSLFPASDSVPAPVAAEPQAIKILKTGYLPLEERLSKSERGRGVGDPKFMLEPKSRSSLTIRENNP
jgi:hypothetical protein